MNPQKVKRSLPLILVHCWLLCVRDHRDTPLHDGAAPHHDSAFKAKIVSKALIPSVALIQVGLRACRAPVVGSQICHA